MINSKLVSIIIPVYNSEKYIKKCIESLINQSYIHIEIILVDDGLNDESGIICDYYAKKDRRIIVIHKENEGAYIARNIGISMAKGEYISFVNSDDWVEKDYIGFLVDNILNFNSDLIVCNYKDVYISKNNIYYGEKRKINSEVLKIDKVMNQDFFINGLVHPCWGKLYKSNIIKNNNILFENLKLSEDTVFNLNYLTFCKNINILENELYFYAHYDCHSSVTSIEYDSIFENYLIVHEYFFQYIKRYKENKYIDIVNKTMYPQYYSAFIKILMCKNFNRKEKVNILNKALSNNKIVDSFNIKQENKSINIINKLIISKQYFLIKCILKYINCKYKKYK